MINGNMIGISSAPLKTLTIVDENNNEYVGIVVGSEVLFTATDNDVRVGSVYAGDSGVSTGTKDIPAYYSSYGHKFVLADQEAVIVVPEYNYKNLMVTISTYNTSWDQSVVSTYISIDNGMYAVGSNTKLSDITIDYDNEQINLGITVSEKSVLRYIVVMEEI